jgi:hypothetical protein
MTRTLEPPKLPGIDWSRDLSSQVAKTPNPLRLPALTKLEVFSQVPDLKFYSRASFFVPLVAQMLSSSDRDQATQVNQLRRNLVNNPGEALRVAASLIPHEWRFLESVIPAMTTLMNAPDISSTTRDRFENALKNFSTMIAPAKISLDLNYGVIAKLGVNPRTAVSLARSIDQYFALIKESMLYS